MLDPPLWGMPSLTELTVCSWMKSSDRKNDGTVFSYAVPGMDNEFIIYNYKNFQIFVNGANRWEEHFSSFQTTCPFL